MKKYGYIYRGRIYETCEAQDWFDAVRIFGEMGLTLYRGDVVAL